MPNTLCVCPELLNLPAGPKGTPQPPPPPPPLPLQRLRADLLAGEGTWRQIWEAEEDYQWRRLLQEARAGALQLSSAVQDRRRWEVRLALMQVCCG